MENRARWQAPPSRDNPYAFEQNTGGNRPISGIQQQQQQQQRPPSGL